MKIEIFSSFIIRSFFIGVEYIIEVDNPENGHVREYHCLLCNAVLPDVDQLFTHLRNSDECDHQVKYLVRN